MEKEKIKNFSLNRESLADQVFYVLRESILDVNVKPGERIRLSNIQEKYDISKAPIREALNRLSNQGLVRVKPRVGYYVVDFSIDQIRELYDIREMFELYALQRSLPGIDLGDVKELRDETENLLEDKLSHEELRKRFDETDEKLHRELIIGNGDNQYLEQFSDQIFDLVYMTKHLIERIEQALEEHLLIIDALLRKDPDEVKDLLKQHMENHLSSLEAEGFEKASEMYS